MQSVVVILEPKEVVKMGFGGVRGQITNFVHPPNNSASLKFVFFPLVQFN